MSVCETNDIISQSLLNEFYNTNISNEVEESSSRRVGSSNLVIKTIKDDFIAVVAKHPRSRTY